VDTTVPYKYKSKHHILHRTNVFLKLCMCVYAEGCAVHEKLSCTTNNITQTHTAISCPNVIYTWPDGKCDREVFSSRLKNSTVWLQPHFITSLLSLMTERHTCFVMQWTLIKAHTTWPKWTSTKVLWIRNCGQKWSL